MAIQTSDSDELLSDINVTPLVDVMLVLLVVFIVTAPLLTNAVKVVLPQTATTMPADQKSSVTLSIDAQGRVYIDKSAVELGSVEPELARRRAKNPEISVHLSADESTRHGLVAKVMASAARAGIAKLSFLSVSE
jgi:biopolymer transport protein ExbD